MESSSAETALWGERPSTRAKVLRSPHSRDFVRFRERSPDVTAISRGFAGIYPIREGGLDMRSCISKPFVRSYRVARR